MKPLTQDQHEALLGNVEEEDFILPFGDDDVDIYNKPLGQITGNDLGVLRHAAKAGYALFQRVHEAPVEHEKFTPKVAIVEQDHDDGTGVWVVDVQPTPGPATFRYVLIAHGNGRDIIIDHAGEKQDINHWHPTAIQKAIMDHIVAQS